MLATNIYSSSLMAFAVSYGLIAIAPGPNFLLVAHAGAAGSRMAAIATTLGIATGASLLALLASTSSSILIENAAMRQMGGWAFGIVLTWGGVRLIRREITARSSETPIMPGSARFGLGFFTALLNPLSALFFASAGLHYKTALGGIPAPVIASTVFLVALFWFSLVGLGMSLKPVREHYERFRGAFNITTGGLLLVSGLSAVLASST